MWSEAHLSSKHPDSSSFTFPFSPFPIPIPFQILHDINSRTKKFRHVTSNDESEMNSIGHQTAINATVLVCIKRKIISSMEKNACSLSTIYMKLGLNNWWLGGWKWKYVCLHSFIHCGSPCSIFSLLLIGFAYYSFPHPLLIIIFGTVRNR